MDVTYCIILIVYSPQPYSILFVTTGDQVCLGRSPDEMAMRPPLLVNHPLSLGLTNILFLILIINIILISIIVSSFSDTNKQHRRCW